MALRGPLGYGTGHLMREDATPCSRHIRAVGGSSAVCGFFCALPLCFLQHGSRTTIVRLQRWGVLGAVLSGCSMAAYSYLWEPCCEPQNVAAYDFKR